MNSLILAVVGGVLAMALAGGAGWQVATWRADAQRVDSVERAIAQAAEIAEQDADILRHAQGRAVATETRFRTINREVVRYVQNHSEPVDCLDADGLRLWRDANTGAAEADSEPPDYSLSAVAAAHFRAFAGFAAESHRGGAAISPVPGPAGGAGRLGEGKTVNQED
jgi:hypothetical protein